LESERERRKEKRKALLMELWRGYWWDELLDQAKERRKERQREMRMGRMRAGQRDCGWERVWVVQLGSVLGRQKEIELVSEKESRRELWKERRMVGKRERWREKLKG
jgi:hypothetical protein